MARAVLTALLALQVFGETNISITMLKLTIIYFIYIPFHCKKLNKTILNFSPAILCCAMTLKDFNQEALEAVTEKDPGTVGTSNFYVCQKTHDNLRGITSYRTTRLGHLAYCFNC
jgi:hypothetical protein